LQRFQPLFAPSRRIMWTILEIFNYEVISRQSQDASLRRQWRPLQLHIDHAGKDGHHFIGSVNGSESISN
ncbi:MAG: hypothetical protein QF701_15930, partial [Nitrospinota bacterium]|nr:hypothetical protein [Nitrospinota bacterium]